MSETDAYFPAEARRNTGANQNPLKNRPNQLQVNKDRKKA